jgi:diguanylate cyclase (GGDEF)-like protein
MRSERQLKLLASAVFIVMVLVAAVPFWLNRSIGALLLDSRQELLRQQRLERVLNLLRDAETGQRGFVITGNPAFLDPYGQAQQSLPQALSQLKDTSRSDAERATAWRIARLAELKLAELDETVALRRKDGFDAAERVISSMRGEHHMDELRRIIAAEIVDTQEQREAMRADMLARSARSFTVSVAATCFNICVLGVLLLILMRMLRARRESARLLGEKAAELGTAAEQAMRHNRELRLIAEMLRTVEALPSSRDAGPAIGRYASRLLPELGGSFFLLRDDDGMLELQAQWGEASGQPAEIELASCWALCHGTRYKTCGYKDPSCAHVRAGADGLEARICIPLVSHDELIGMMHLEGLAADAARQEQQERLAVALAEQLALALANAKLRESLRRQSVLDALTGLFNRRYFDETLKRELARSRRKSAPMSLLVLDIDHFKRVNDSYGHAAGDAVLRTIAQQVRSWIREGDVACRYGGEEFVILMPECGVEVSTLRADMLRAAIEATVLNADGHGPHKVTASFGVAEYPSHGADADALFWAADKALYRAKQLGRNRVVTVGEDG